MVHGLEVLLALNEMAAMREVVRKAYKESCGEEKCCGKPQACEVEYEECSACDLEPNEECLIAGSVCKKVGEYYDGKVLLSGDGFVHHVQGSTIVTRKKHPKRTALPMGYEPLSEDQLHDLVGTRVYTKLSNGDKEPVSATAMINEVQGSLVPLCGGVMTAEDLCREWFFDRDCTKPVGVAVM